MLSFEKIWGFFFLNIKARKVCFWKYQNSFLLGEYKKTFLWRKYKKFINISARKFYFWKYKEFFRVVFFRFFGFGMGSARNLLIFQLESFISGNIRNFFRLVFLVFLGLGWQVHQVAISYYFRFTCDQSKNCSTIKSLKIL